MVPGVPNATQPVEYSAPAVSGGAAPVTTTCTPASGASFPLGTTNVSCAASDAQSRQASCSFKVTLIGVALAIKRFEAVGDSLTEGENGRFSFLDLPNAYPTRLQAAFDTTYPGQGIVVINRGMSGWSIERTVEELPGDLAPDRPDAVLVLSGYNDLFNGCGRDPVGSADCQDALRTVQIGTRDCIHRSRESPAVKYVFVSTLTPPGPVAPGAPRDRRISNDAIVQANARIQQIVASEGATLVDSYTAFLGHEAEYTDTDGLHLRPAGYQALADAFFASIKATVPQTPLLAVGR